MMLSFFSASAVLITWPSMTIITPNENDILLGRGGNNYSWAGNEQLRNMAKSRVEEYQAATKKQKPAIAEQILRQIQCMEPPGRFIFKSKEAYGWEVAPHAQAKEKVCQVSC